MDLKKNIQANRRNRERGPFAWSQDGRKRSHWHIRVILCSSSTVSHARLSSRSSHSDWGHPSLRENRFVWPHPRPTETKSLGIKKPHHMYFFDNIPRFWVLKKTLVNSLDSKEIKPVNPKGNQPWIFIGRTDVEAETPILWPPDAKSWLIGKNPDARRDWRREEKGTTEDEMAGWHHRLNGHEFEQTLGDTEGPGSLVCWSPWGHKELDTT